MTTVRARVANGSLMAAVAALIFALSAWSIGLNSATIHGAPAGERWSAVLGSAWWLSAPILLGALPAWFLARAGLDRGLGPQHGRMTRWFIGAWVLNVLALSGVWLVLLWHARAGESAPAVDLPVLILGIWSTAFTAYVPALIALQARRREAEEAARLDTAERDADEG